MIPDAGLLTRDRWVIWEIRNNLLEYYGTGKPDRIRETIPAIEHWRGLGLNPDDIGNELNDNSTADLKPTDGLLPPKSGGNNLPGED